MTQLLVPDWIVRDVEEEDLAPEFYEGLEEHSCDGVGEVSHGFAASTPASRGWGPGWPNCQTAKWRTLTRPDGIRFVLREEIIPLQSILLHQTELMGYDLIPGQCWGAACRSIRGSSNPSNHSWALADDLNSLDNPMGSRNGKIRRHPEVIEMWKEYGHGWGGDYQGRPDDMHFEFLLSPADAKRLYELAVVEFGLPNGGGDVMDKKQEQKLDDLTTLVKKHLGPYYGPLGAALYEGADDPNTPQPEYAQHLKLLTTQVKELRSAVSSLQTGGIDEEALAAKVAEIVGPKIADLLAERLKD